ncbi:MAG: hypothetical protein U0586_05775 [Candidatus Brocadiaceae bacterium]
MKITKDYHIVVGERKYRVGGRFIDTFADLLSLRTRESTIVRTLQRLTSGSIHYREQNGFFSCVNVLITIQ